MKKLYAPWRSAYAQRINKKENNGPCVFCHIIATTDDASEFILQRMPECMILLNKYPYNPGHLLIVPYTHTSTLHTLTSSERVALIEQTSRATDIVTTTLSAQGCNVGINIGKAAGAGIPEHIHLHVLPRFLGDTNFLPTLADTKQISIDLHEIYATLLPAF